MQKSQSSHKELTTMEKLEARYACMFQTLRELEGKEQEF
jgi:hypothetical protein